MIRSRCVGFLRATYPLLVSILVFATCAFASQTPVRKAPVNIILITIDTVRSDHLGCYGDRQIQTPTLDALAHDGVVFDRAVAQVPLTWPSHAVILTGTYPFQNGVQDFTGTPLNPRFRSVAQAFHQRGYSTGAVVSAFVLDRSWGLARGFDFYDDTFSAVTFRQKDIGLVDRRADESVRRAINWLKSARRPFFFWLHLYDPHSPYDPPEPYRTQYQGHLYDGEIAYADHELGRLIAWLKQNQLYDRTAIVFLSDHGESLGEHGEQEHGFFVYNSTVHIPLIVKPPAGSGIQPGHVARPVETTAVAPTLLHLAGVKDIITQQFNSHGLLGAAAEKEDDAYSETFYPFSSFGWSPLHAVETPRYHYIDAPIAELYDLVADPAEKNNVASQQGGTVAVFKDKLQSLLRKNPFTSSEAKSSGLGPDAAEKLRALGYVAYRSPVSAEALAAGLPDPKDKLGEFNSILRAQDAFQAGDFDTGKQLLDRVRQQDPQIYTVPFMLAEAAMRQQKWDEAAAHFRQCLELNPNFDQAMTGLAHALTGQGKVEEARPWIEKALQFNPQNYRAWYDLGTLDVKADRAAAASDYAKALAIQPNFAPLRRDFGMLQFEQKNYAEAAKHLAKAIELGLSDAKTYNFLGISYSQTGQLQQAVDSYAKALKLNPDLAETHLNLAYAYQRMNRPKAAQEEYGAACKLEQKFCQFVPRRQP
ncbi:MAG: sulfatase-like hydrolase/transferase [Acidobacteriia bacterium]|nr:sulfatase-like hydrolase/transferase [Terriglobia bacterium]